MMIFKKALPRRTFLRGAGTTLALPLLDAMLPAFTASAKAFAQPMRVGYVYVPVGRIMNKWQPTTVGSAYELTPTLAPFAPFRDQMLVISGLDVKAAAPQPGTGGGQHARPCSSFLTGVPAKPGGRLGISVDQVIARQLGRDTRFASLELGLDPAGLQAADDGAYSGYFQSTISWRSATTPLPTEDTPRKVFERLFGDSDSTDATVQLRRTQRQRSILDSIMQRMGRLSREVGSADRVKLDEYSEAIRDIERRIASAGSTTSEDRPGVKRPGGIPTTFTEHAKLMFDMQALAWQSDSTRVSSLMMGHESSNRVYKEVGAENGHHALSHHKGLAEAIAMVEKIDLLQSQLFAYFVDKLKATPDGDGSLFDHSMILYGSSLSDANLHQHTNVPIVIAGGARGVLKGGRHLRYKGQPLSNLHLTMLAIAGVEDELYRSPDSDATGRLEGLTT
jgi:hypothetical protein